MTQARRKQVSLDDTPYYHCISRCVRRAFLCGEDRRSGQSFEHRRQWVVDRLHGLAGIFAIQICAFTVLSNHYHVIVRVDKEQAQSWDTLAVSDRWHRLFRGSPLSQRYVQGETLSTAEFDVLAADIDTWRERLMDISWFMKLLNEFIAREAN